MDTRPAEQAIAHVCAGFPEVAVAYLFGSVARGEARPDSDVDVGIVLSGRGTRMDDGRIGDLASRLESALGRPVDLVELEPQGALFAHQVLLEGKRAFIRDEERRVDFESETAIRADDERPMRDRYLKEKFAETLRWLEARR